MAYLLTGQTAQPRSTALPVPFPARSPQDETMHATAFALMKAVEAGRKPAYVHHHVNETTRFFAGMNGIHEDMTVHLNDEILRALAKRNVAVQMVLMTILPQIVRHFRKPEREGNLGLRVVQKERKKSVTPASARLADDIEKVLFRGGIPSEHPRTGEVAVWDGHYRTRADPLPTAMRKWIQDSLILDKAFMEIESSVLLGGKARNPVMFWAMTDAKMMRFADPDRYIPHIRNGGNGADDITGRVRYVRLAAQGGWQVDREYTWRDGDMLIRNVRTDWDSYGYGESEVEKALNAIMGVLYGMQSNTDYFSGNKLPRGILNLIGNFSQKDLDAVRIQFQQQIGMVNSGMYEFPIIATPKEMGAGAVWVPLDQKENFDMVSKTFLTFSVAVVSAIFQIAPEEFGMSSFGGPDSTLNLPDPESTIKHSTGRNVLPKVLWALEALNRNIVERLSPDHEAIIQGLDSVYDPDAMLQSQQDQQEMELGYTLNMVRARRDLPPVVDPLDMEMWRGVEAKLANEWFANDTLRLFSTIDAYKKQGGKLASWPDSPSLNPQAFQVWMQEHGLGEQQAAQDQMGDMAGAEADSDREGDAMEAQGAQDHLNASADTEMTRAADEQGRTDEANAKGEMRVPQADDAARGAFQQGPSKAPSAPAAPGKRPAGSKRPTALRKALAEAAATGRDVEVVIRVAAPGTEG